MLRMVQPPHHVRVQIEAREIKEEQALVKFRELDVERAPMFGEHGARLFQILLIVEHTGGERLRIFGNSFGVEFADLFPPVAPGIRWRRDWQGRIFRVDIDWRYVKLKTRTRLLY